MKNPPTLEEVESMSDEEALALEAELVEQSPNQVKPEDGPQPPQDESPGLEYQED